MIIIVYDVTNASSFDYAKEVVQDLHKRFSIPLLLVGNKNEQLVQDDGEMLPLLDTSDVAPMVRGCFVTSAKCGAMIDIVEACIAALPKEPMFPEYDDPSLVAAGIADTLPPVVNVSVPFNLEHLYNSPQFLTDFQVHLIPLDKTIHVHKCILAGASNMFKQMFSQKMTESKSNELIIDDEVEAIMLEKLLQFCYSGNHMTPMPC